MRISKFTFSFGIGLASVTSTFLILLHQISLQSFKRPDQLLKIIEGKIKYEQIWPMTNPESDRIFEQQKYQPKERKKEILIYYADGFKERNLNSHQFRDDKCLMQNCRLTDNTDDRQLADAVVFYLRSIEYSQSFERPPDQIWVIEGLESPHHSPTYKRMNNMVNYTMTYRWDSDIVRPYGKVVPIAKTDTSKVFEALNMNFAKLKSKMVAWFVSNCNPANDRKEYGSELSKYIEVDIYGACGTHACELENPVCFQSLNNDYRFYLAFENSNCREYVTEKFFVNGLRHDVIPVVLGASKSYYKRIAPPNSFIHVSDFKSPEELANYLHYLSANNTAYNEYFKWKGNYDVITDTKTWCRLCAILNEPKYKVYHDLYKWWNTDANCSRRNFKHIDEQPDYD